MGFEPRSDHPAAGPAVARPAAGEPTLLRRVLPGAALLLASIVLTLVDQAFASSSGSVLSLGPLKASWVAGFLMVAGVILLVYRLLPRGSS